MGAALSRFFNFGKDGSTSTSASSADNSAAEEAKKRKEAQRLAAEERKRELAALAEEKRMSSQGSAQEKRIAQQKAAEQRRKVIEEKRAIAQAQAEARKKDIEEKKRVAAAAKVKQAEKVIKSSDLINSKPSRTISLFGFGQKQDTTATTTTTTTTKTKAPPRGVPIIKGWKQNKDGSITGFISGSPNYDDGEIVTTSKLKTSGVIEGGSIVQTISGSRYYLDPKVPKSNIGLFSRTKKTSTATTNTIKKKESKTIPVSRTTSLFSTKSVVPPKGIPKFVNWKKNKD